STYCSCPDYENNEFRSENYCCKHLVATFYESVDDILKNSLFNDDKEEDIFQSKNNVDTLSMLLGDEKHKEEIKIE
ncbi:hypothetical protein HJW02_13110, partial [Akkermansia sp. GGCC_0220]|nr:hypothetical protein [Akkermansia sp. GGCC_0220]